VVAKTPPSDLELAALVPDPRVLQAHLGLHRVDLLVGAHDLRDHQITGADLLQPRRLRVGALLLVRLRERRQVRVQLRDRGAVRVAGLVVPQQLLLQRVVLLGEGAPVRVGARHLVDPADQLNRTV
jgi:hypothetical protein